MAAAAAAKGCWAAFSTHDDTIVQRGFSSFYIYRMQERLNAVPLHPRTESFPAGEVLRRSSEMSLDPAPADVGSACEKGTVRSKG
jgi:hypothetical protein